MIEFDNIKIVEVDNLSRSDSVVNGLRKFQIMIGDHNYKCHCNHEQTAILYAIQLVNLGMNSDFAIFTLRILGLKDELWV